MSNDKIYSTEEILENLRNNETVPDEQLRLSADTSNERLQIAKDIQNLNISQSAFATNCYLSGSHLNEFLSGKKKFGRDNLLRLFISLGYDFNQIKTLLRRFEVPELYPRHKRDYIIIEGILQQQPLDNIDQRLKDNGLESLCQSKRN